MLRFIYFFLRLTKDCIDFFFRIVVWKCLIYNFIWNFIIKFLLWDFTSAKYIITKSWNTIRPPINIETGKRPPSTFLLWISGICSIYFVLFSIANERYLRKISVIEFRANSIFTQLGVKEISQNTLSRIPSVQNMPCPCMPELKKPFSVYISLMYNCKYPDMVNLMRETIEIRKNNLSRVDLTGINLSYADLTNANFRYTNLSHSNLTGANLLNADLTGALFSGAILINVKGIPKWLESGLDSNGVFSKQILINSIHTGFKNISGANLDNVDLSNTELISVNFINTSLKKTNIENTKFIKAIGLPKWVKYGIDQKGIYTQKKLLYNINHSNFKYLVNSNLFYADFSNLNLEETNFSNANLIGSNFYNAIIDRSNFENSTLNKATNLPQWIQKGLDHNKIYKQKILIKAIKKGFKNLVGANLSKVNFNGINLDEADLRRAELSWANFENTSVNRVNFEEAIFQNAKGLPEWVKKGLNDQGIFYKRILVSEINTGLKDLEGAFLPNSHFTSFNWTDAKLKNADLSNCLFEYDTSSFRECPFTRANFENAVLTNSKNIPTWVVKGLNSKGIYSQSRLIHIIKNEKFKELSGAYLYKANLKGIDLSNAELAFADLSYANLQKANLRSISCGYSKFIGADLTEADISGDVDIDQLNISDFSSAKLPPNLRLRLRKR